MVTVKIHWKREPALAVVTTGRFLIQAQLDHVWERLTGGTEGEPPKLAKGRLLRL